MAEYLVVTHIAPDFDALCGCWLMARRLEEQGHTVKLAFVRAGETPGGVKVDSDPHVIHIDTGRGRFDHHREGDRFSCSSLLVARELGINKDPAYQRIIQMARESDAGKGQGYGSLPLLVHTRNRYHPPEQVARRTFEDLDDLLAMEQERAEALGELSSKLRWCKTGLGWACVYEVPADSAGFFRVKAQEHKEHPAVLTIARDPETGFVQISSWDRQGRKQIDLTWVANAVVQAEERKRGLPPSGEYYSQSKKTPPSGKLTGRNWFLHESRGLIACGTAKHPIPPDQLTCLSFAELVQIVIASLEEMHKVMS